MERNNGSHSKQRFDEWAPSYEQGLLWRMFFLPVYRQLQRVLPAPKGMHILDIGCGTGALARNLNESGARVTGVDESKGMIEEARRRSGDREGLSFLMAGAESLPLEDACSDLVVTSVAFHHFQNAGKALKEMRRVLKPGSAMYICDLCGEGLPGRISLCYGRIKEIDHHYYSKQDLATMMKDNGLMIQEVTMLRKIPPVMLIVGFKPE